MDKFMQKYQNTILHITILTVMLATLLMLIWVDKVIEVLIFTYAGVK